MITSNGFTVASIKSALPVTYRVAPDLQTGGPSIYFDAPSAGDGERKYLQALYYRAISRMSDSEVQQPVEEVRSSEVQSASEPLAEPSDEAPVIHEGSDVPPADTNDI